MAIQIGDTATRQRIVTPDTLACQVGSGSVTVFATPMVAALMGGAAADFAHHGWHTDYREPQCTFRRGHDGYRRGYFIGNRWQNLPIFPPCMG